MNARHRKTMSYKGYTVKPEYSEEDGMFVGFVLGIRAVIECIGKSVEEFEADFHGQIDFYLEICEKHGIPSAKPETSRSKASHPAKSPVRSTGVPRGRRRKEAVEA